MKLALGLITLIWLCLGFSINAYSTPLTEATSQIVNGRSISQSQKQTLLQDPDGQFLLARFHEFGSYGFPLNGDAAFRLYQQAAENGQMSAALYCWDRCLHKTLKLGEAIQQAAEKGDPNGLYLWAKWLGEKGQLQAADDYLVKAARERQPNAINKLYLQHFINWSANQTDVDKAEAKLQKCVKEGLVTCQLLLGAFYQRHNDADKALFHYLQLVQLDYPLSRTYLYADEMDALLKRMPKDSLAILQSRVATALVAHPATEFDRYNQFKACQHQTTYACIRKVVKRDDACMISGFAGSYFAELRQTPAYRRCLNQ